MTTVNGFEVEEKLCESINNKTYYDLNKNLQYLVFYLFRHLNKEIKFNCFCTKNFNKPDICISQQRDLKYISVKSGQCEGVHNEDLRTFIEFLKENKISDESIETYLLYHYGDGTTDGTGERRMNTIEVRFTYDDRIKKMNEEFNESKDFIKKFANRVLFQGVDPDAVKAEFIYHGDVDYGVFCSRNQIMRHIERRNWDYMQTCVHIGPFTLRPHARYARSTYNNVKHEDHRHIGSVNYPRFLQDLMYISSRQKYDYNPNK